MITTEEIMGYEPCYSEKLILELWAGRPSLSPREIAELDILKHDRVWALCHCLAHRDLGALTRFTAGCEARASEAVVVAAAADAAADAAASEARARAAAARAAARAAAWAAADAAAAARAAWVAERQLQLDELVAALEEFNV